MANLKRNFVILGCVGKIKEALRCEIPEISESSKIEFKVVKPLILSPDLRNVTPKFENDIF